jgi:tRNA-specific 2-thiouridylase
MTVVKINLSKYGKLNVLFHSAVSAIAPGQSAVFYGGEELVGGGIIERQFPIGF